MWLSLRETSRHLRLSLSMCAECWPLQGRPCCRLHWGARYEGLWGPPHALSRLSLPAHSLAVVISQGTSPLRGESGFEDVMGWQVVSVFRKLLEG